MNLQRLCVVKNWYQNYPFAIETRRIQIVNSIFLIEYCFNRIFEDYWCTKLSVWVQL